MGLGSPPVEGTARQLAAPVTLEPDIVERFNTLIANLRRPAETRETRERRETPEITDPVGCLITQLAAGETTGWALPLAQQEDVARRLWQERRTQKEILTLLYGVKAGDNDDYKTALARYRAWRAPWAGTAPAEGSTDEQQP